MTAEDIIAILKMEPHPEGGFFRETFRDTADDGSRPHSTAIYYLLREGERSHWHRVDAVEVWHWYAGAPLELGIAPAEGGEAAYVTLGQDLIDGQRPQAVVPTGAWQAARSLGSFTLVGCTVAPGFEFSGFELAPAGWTPQL